MPSPVGILFVLFLSCVSSVAQSPSGSPLPAILLQLGKQAEAFRRIAPLTLSEETLEQRSRPDQPGSSFETHEVISAYGFAGLRNAPRAIHEVRKVISVDGHQVTSLSKARQAMTLGLKSTDDKLKKRLLEDLERNGLRGAATDFGQVILLFSPQRLQNYTFKITGERQVGADRLIVVGFTQKAGDSGVTVFRGNSAERESLQGEISLRGKDLIPLRITMTSTGKSGDLLFREESTVDYATSFAGCVLPVSVVHREFQNNELLSENLFSYAPFRKLTPGAQLTLPPL